MDRVESHSRLKQALELSMVERVGASFEDPAVVENYLYRPSYPVGVYEKLLSIAPGRNCLLDLGCGPGKISRQLSEHFHEVVAVDPSRSMIDLARRLERGNASNIRWVVGLAEDYDGAGHHSPDLIVAAASIHWMDHNRLFPRLKSLASDAHQVAIVSGDTPFQPPWAEDWKSFLAKWVPIATGGKFDHDGKQEKRSEYKSFLDVDGTEFFLSKPMTQNVDDFIRCQHSRDTFAPSHLGETLPRFDIELRELLTPYAEDQSLRFSVGSEVVWGTIKPD